MSLDTQENQPKPPPTLISDDQSRELQDFGESRFEVKSDHTGDLDSPGSGDIFGPDLNSTVEYPRGLKLCAIIVPFYLAGFLTTLDRTIIVNAIPRITDQFDSIDDIGWYGSAYLLTFCAFQLLFGKIYSFYNLKWVFLTSVVIFEIGSAICGAAPNSTALIVGRAIAGLGSSGIFTGGVIVTFFTVPLHKRPIFAGIVSVLVAISSATGPLVGGALTQDVTWRWCFYLNLPIGAVAIVAITLALPIAPVRRDGTRLRDQILQMDPLGNLCLIPGIMCLLLALQWGGQSYAWNSKCIIALFVLAGVLLLSFIIIQIRLPENATIPPRIIKQRSVAAGVVFSLMVNAAMMTFNYYLPIWLQAIKSASPVRSGVMMLPTVISSAVASLTTGLLIHYIGYYTPFMIGGSILMSVGAGLLTMFTPHIDGGKLIGYQIPWAVGCGMSMQQASLAAQAVLPRQDGPIGIALIFFAQSLGGSVFLSVDQAIYSNRLSSNLGDIANLTDGGVTSVQDRVSPSDLPQFLNGYNSAVINVFRLAFACSCACIVASAFMEWRSVQPAKGTQGRPGSPGGRPGKEYPAPREAIASKPNNDAGGQV